MAVDESVFPFRPNAFSARGCRLVDRSQSILRVNRASSIAEADFSFFGPILGTNLPKSYLSTAVPAAQSIESRAGTCRARAVPIGGRTLPVSIAVEPATGAWCPWCIENQKLRFLANPSVYFRHLLLSARKKRSLH